MLTDVADEPAASLKGALSRRQILTRAGVAVAGTTAAAAIGGTTTAGAMASGSSTTIQEMIDALPAEGGIVTIPAGTFVGPRLTVRDGVILQGQGWSTVIPPFVESSEPRFRISLRDLAVDWTNITVDVPSVQYGIDWRFISNGSITNVKVSGGTHGLLVDFAAQCNVFTGLVAQATEVAVELYGVDSDSPIGNVFVGGRFSAPTCLILAGDSQANNLIGVIFEGPDRQTLFRRGPFSNNILIFCYVLLPDGTLVEAPA